MNLAVARYYGTVPVEKTASSRSDAAVEAIVGARVNYLNTREKVASVGGQVEPWLKAWDVAESEGEAIAKTLMKATQHERF